VVLGITPAATVQGSGSDPDFGVTIVGQNFMAPLTAWLSRSTRTVAITVSSVAATIITGTLSPNIPVGVYALTVRNDTDFQEDTLSPAFTVLPRPHPTTTFESAVAFVTTFGPAALPTEGDDDYVQIIFFEVPDATAPDDLYIRIFDADTGGAIDEVGADLSFGETTMTYAVRGGLGAYTGPDAQSDHPTSGINTGTLITQQVIGVDALLEGQWLTLPVSRTQGEPIGGSRVFKLVVQGASGDDGNWYHVAISSDPANNVAVSGARVFAFSWCVVLPASGDEVTVYPYVPLGIINVRQVNFDFDAFIGAGITLTTPIRTLPVSDPGLSRDGNSAFQDLTVFGGEEAMTWNARYVSSFPSPYNDFSFWFFGDGVPLAIFTAPTLRPRP
jgi:hypothetical protein